MQDQYFDENFEEQLSFNILIPRLSQQYECQIEKKILLSEFFEHIAELVNSDVKQVRLMCNGQRISNDPNKTVGDEFKINDQSVIEITVFTESQGAYC